MSIRSIRRPRASLGWCAGTVSLFLILALNFSVVQADTFTVTTLSNSGPGSLRQAILDANADLTTSHTITFQSGLTGTITLTDGKIAIIGRMTITGPGASILAVSGNNASQVFDVSSLSATISGLTIKEGKSSYGGGINNNGYLTLNQVTVSDNTATNSGGGISSGGYLTLNQVTVSNNASDSGNGGGISLGGTATITNTVIDSNQTGGSYGGGIYAGSTLTITNSTLSNNGSFGCGGGIYINSGSKTVNITNSTLSGNVAHTNGGGICNSSGNVTVTNSTLTANLAIQYGGGISGFTSGFTLHNSIVAGNTALNGPEIVGNSDAESASSLFGENGVSGVQGLTPPATEVIAGPLSSVIGPLADNGGPTQTHALVAGSPAINAGDNSLIPTGITTDQRGQPRIQNSTVDIGAVEGTSGGGANTYTLTVGTSGGNGIVISTPTGINCGATCTAPFNSGSTVTLIATPLDSTVSFTGWSGDCNNLTGPCVVTMDSAKSVTALFSNASPTAYSLTLAKAGAGSGTVSGAGSYAAGATVNLTATPSAGSAFSGWSPSPCAASFTMPANNLVCTATFTSGSTGGNYALNVALSGVGVGSVVSQPSGISCSNLPGDDADCSETYAANTQVTLTTTPGVGPHYFSGWSGACSGTGACTVTMNAAKSVTAAFATGYALTLTYNPEGSIARDPIGSNCTFASATGDLQCIYAPNTVVTLTAVPAGGTFTGWGGGSCTGTDACQITMTGNKTVSAAFTTGDPISRLITHYYVSITERAPDDGGLAFWKGLVEEKQAQGADVKEVFRQMADFFFNSEEYLGRNTTDRQFITNLYRTFFQRAPDDDGYAFWLGQLAGGMSRNDAMRGFLYSQEFTDFMKSVLGEA